MTAFKCTEERNVSIRRSLLGHPIDYELDDDSYVSSGGLMLEGCHSTSGEPQTKRKSPTLRTIVLALFEYRLMKHNKFSITFKSELLLGQSKISTVSRRSRSSVFAVCGVHGSIVHEHGLSCNGWLSRCGTAWVSRTTSKFRQAVILAPDLEKCLFAITENVPRRKYLPGEDTLYCPSGDIRDSTNGGSFYTRNRSPYYRPSLTIGRTYCGCLEEILPIKRQGRSEFTGHEFVTTGSITMKHGRNGIGVSISRCRNFHKNKRNFTESNKSLKTKLILKNNIVPHLERSTHWVKHLAPLFVLWKCTPIQLYCLQNWERSPDWKVFKKQIQ